MSPFTAWLPVGSERTSDLVLKMVGTGTAGLIDGATALEWALTEQGLRVMAQTSPGLGGSGSAVRLRVSTEPITSLGSGCDVVACMDRTALRQQWFDLLQPGSVFIHEAGADAAAVPDGVIAYAVPFSDLHRRCGARFSGKGFIAAGVLAHLLGIPERIVRSRIRPHVGLRYFDAGVGFASAHLEKRDIYVTPSPAGAPRQIMLDAHQALLLGLTIGGCDCRSACAQSLDRRPHEWIAEHVRAARERVSTLAHRETSCLQVYRGSDGEVMALLGAADPSAVPGQGANRPHVLVAADMLDAIRLAGLARRGGRANAGAVWVVVDEILAARRQSVPVEQLVDIVAGTARAPENKVSPPPRSLEWRPEAEWDRDPGATIGYVAWGAAQGVVREAVTLCRSFGLNVSALYPTVLWPAPTRELEAFAETVERVIVVEPDRAGRYTRFIRNQTCLPAVTVMPEPGRALTPMDIFMREGLGT